ncbi:hypothetical protein [uncultured Microbulbifer sp.]|nr:hypothetical protein [uncultured Microbulbifer sp.]
MTGFTIEARRLKRGHLWIYSNEVNSKHEWKALSRASVPNP